MVRQGLSGRPDPPGATGPAGPAGPGLSGFRYISSTRTIAATSSDGVEVQCGAGEIVVSGGGSTSAGLLYTSSAVPAQGWLIEVENFSSSSGTMFVQALCARRTGTAASTTSQETPDRP